MHDPIVSSFFLIFTGAAVLGTLALYARQSLLLAYILLGILLGPSVLGLIPNLELLEQISHIGITFLLFLLGLDLQPRELLHLLRKTTMVTLASSALFAAVGYVAGQLTGFTPLESLLIGAAAMFSSTIIGIKLLPTTVLHHQHAGEIMTSVLLLQDLIAILVLLLLQGHAGGEGVGTDIALLGIFLVAVVVAAFVIEAYVLRRLLTRFDRIREYVFLLAIGWCLGIAELSAWLGLSTEVGAFIAGVSLAASPIAPYIADSLRPLRDFFLVVFFFSLGGAFDLGMLADVLLPAALFAAALLLIKPWVFRGLLTRLGEKPALSLEMGVRLGQISEFSLLIAVLAAATGVIGERASFFIQAATILTFVLSSWYIVRIYPTPIAVTDALRRD